MSLILISLSGYASTGEKYEIAARDGYAPFSYTNQLGQLSGFVVDITKHIMDKNDLKYNFTLVSKNSDLIYLVNTHKTDIIAGTYFMDDQQDSVLFTSPIYYLSLATVSLKDKPYFSLESLRGKRLLALKDDWTHKAVEDLGLSKDITTFSTFEEGLEMLSSGEYDVLFYYEQVARYYLSRNRIDDYLVEPADANIMGLCIGISKDHPELLEMMESALHEMKMSGEYSKIYSNWFGVYDNKYMANVFTIVVLCITLMIAVCLLILLESYRKVKVARKNAENANKLKTLFLENISHDIRTPLNSIVGFTSLIVEEDLSKKEELKYMQIIQDNTTTLVNLMDEVLDLCQIETGEFSHHPVMTDVGECFDKMEIIFRKMMTNPDVELIFDKPVKSCRCILDYRRLYQVMSNFFTNAVQFTKKGSITVGYTYTKEELRVFVTDTGIGISAEDQELLFNRFYKVNSVDDGHGLGLAINKAIMDALKGEIGVISTLGKGSTFWAKIRLS